MRLLVLGSPGSGKSQFSQRLGHELGRPVTHLDDIYWQENWSRPSREQWLSSIRRICGEDSWIIDGNYASTLELRLERATHVIVVQTGALTCLSRIIMRSFRIHRGDRSGLPAQVRLGELTSGRRARATKDFGGLIKLVLLYRARVYPSMRESLMRAGVAVLELPTKESSTRDAVQTVRRFLSDSAD